MTSDTVAAVWQFLRSDRGQELLRELDSLAEQNLNSLETVSRLRAATFTTEEVSAALSQAKLRRKAARKFGAHTHELLYTQAGLEQATRLEVAHTHAQRFLSAGITSVADLGCGLGAESFAFAAAGLSVTAVELDPTTASIATFNLRRFSNASVERADATAFAVPQSSAVFLDPARRTSGHANTVRLTNTDEYMPSLDFAFGLAHQHPTAIKLGPGFDRASIPHEAHAQWTSVDGEAVEMMLWFGALASLGVTRSAVVIRNGVPHELSAASDAPDAAVQPLGNYLYEPDPAIIRARLIGQFGRSHNLGMLDDRIAYLTGDTVVDSPFAQGFRVREVLPASESKLKKVLKARNIGRLEIKKRGMDVDPAQLRKRLALRGDNDATLILTRAQNERIAILADRM